MDKTEIFLESDIPQPACYVEIGRIGNYLKH